MEYTYSNEQLLEMYRHLKMGRIFTLKMHESVYKGLLRSSFHTPYGQEAIGVAILSAMRKTDWLGFTHRLQTGLIMRYDLKDFIAELFGLRDSIKCGSAFDYHIADYKPDGLRILTLLGTLGGTVPMNTGFAWAKKLRGIDEVSVIVHGDGGCSEGSVYEGWNLAALYKVPAVYVIENNQWAMTVPLDRETANPNICEKAGACGLPYQIVDGNDILAVRHAMDIAIEKARKNEPNVVELKTLRWEAHFVGQGNDYRNDTDKIKAGMEKDDCVVRYENYLKERGLIDQAYIDNLAKELEAEVDNAIEEASKSERPRFDDIYRKEYIYANPETGGDL
jgi:TPP-dependent pyruvate/acetoin dehydrogenase alpha subunit